MRRALDSAIVKCDRNDFGIIYRVINESSRVYAGVIPEDCWTKPYMPKDELQAEIDDGVEFWGYRRNGETLGVMGIQNVKDVTLIRHAYVLPSRQREGIGSLLLTHLRRLTDRQVLVGTWADASWAVRFYEKHGFRRVTSRRETYRLLKKYWKVPKRQMLTSVVLASGEWFREDR